MIEPEAGRAEQRSDPDQNDRRGHEQGDHRQRFAKREDGYDRPRPGLMVAHEIDDGGRDAVEGHSELSEMRVTQPLACRTAANGILDRDGADKRCRYTVKLSTDTPAGPSHEHSFHPVPR